LLSAALEDEGDVIIIRTSPADCVRVFSPDRLLERLSGRSRRELQCEWPVLGSAAQPRQISAAASSMPFRATPTRDIVVSQWPATSRNNQQ
jgi:hypothetical protein